MFRRLLLGIILSSFLVAPITRADDFPDPSDIYVGETFKYPILDVHPTQAACGMEAVADKVEEMDDLSHKKLKKLLKKQKNLIPVVLAPNGELYMIDHHHQALAALKEGRENAFFILHRDYSKLEDMDAFWKRMKDNSWVREFDENGKRIRIPEGLPKTVKGLKNDRYRSLSFFLRESGGYRKSNVEFAEFEWADYFRDLKGFKIGKGKAGMKKAVEEALEIAHSSATKRLPGWSSKPIKCQSWLKAQEE